MVYTKLFFYCLSSRTTFRSTRGAWRRANLYEIRLRYCLKFAKISTTGSCKLATPLMIHEFETPAGSPWRGTETLHSTEVIRPAKLFSIFELFLCQRQVTYQTRPYSKNRAIYSINGFRNGLQSFVFLNLHWFEGQSMKWFCAFLELQLSDARERSKIWPICS